jgi:hypothetical protein
MRASVLFRVYRYTALCSGEAKFYIDDISDARQAPEQRVQFCRSRRPSANCLFSGEKKGEKRLKSTRRSARLDHAPTLIAPITARHRFQGPRIFCTRRVGQISAEASGRRHSRHSRPPRQADFTGMKASLPPHTDNNAKRVCRRPVRHHRVTHMLATCPGASSSTPSGSPNADANRVGASLRSQL